MGTGHSVVWIHTAHQGEEDFGFGQDQREVRISLPRLQEIVLLLGDRNSVPENQSHIRVGVRKNRRQRHLSVDCVDHFDRVFVLKHQEEAFQHGDSQRLRESVSSNIALNDLLWIVLHFRFHWKHLHHRQRPQYRIRRTG